MRKTKHWLPAPHPDLHQHQHSRNFKMKEKSTAINTLHNFLSIGWRSIRFNQFALISTRAISNLLVHLTDLPLHFNTPAKTKFIFCAYLHNLLIWISFSMAPSANTIH